MSVTIQFSRVVVGISADTSAGALSAAADIARLFSAELAGLYIEDETVFGITELPFSTEIAVAGAARPFRRDDAEAAYRTGASTMRHRLEVVAQTARLKHTFVRERGAVATIIEQTARVGDIVVFVEPERALERACFVTMHYLAAALASASSVLYVPRGAAAWRGGVVAVVDGTVDAAVLTAALRIAAARAEPLTILATGKPPGPADLAAELARDLHLSLPKIEVRQVSAGEASALIREPGAFDDRLLVIARDAAAVSSPQDLRALAGARHAPILLIEPERTQA